MTIKEEAEKVTADGSKYIPPYKLNKIADLAVKTVKLLTDSKSVCTFCYEDMKLVLKIAEEIIDKGVSSNEA